MIDPRRLRGFLRTCAGGATRRQRDETSVRLDPPERRLEQESRALKRCACETSGVQGEPRSIAAPNARKNSGGVGAKTSIQGVALVHAAKLSGETEE